MNEDRREYKAIIEKAIRGLGDAWKAEIVSPHADEHRVKAVRDDGASVFFARWSHRNGKVDISGCYPRAGDGYHFRPYGDDVPGISVSLRTPKEVDDGAPSFVSADRIAKAIQKRFLPKYLPLYEDRLAACKEHDSKCDEARVKADALADVLGGEAREWGGNGKGNHFRVWCPDGGHIDVTSYGIKVDLSYVSFDVAKQLCEVLRNAKEETTP